MDSERFDRLSRRIGAQTTRRSALAALAALGLGGVARLDSDAASSRGKKHKKQCTKKKPCPVCQKCNKHHKCKPLADGTACAQGATCQGGVCGCASGSFPCVGACCPNGHACTEAGCVASCPAGGNFCTGAVQCGVWGPDAAGSCGCVTSVGSTTVCTSGADACVSCEVDADCATALGAPGVCVDVSAGCVSSCSSAKICVYASCRALSATADGAGKRRRPIDMGSLISHR